jgi:GAF domain-containing protein
MPQAPLEPPTRAHAFASLERAIGRTAAFQLWQEVTRAIGIGAHAEPTPQQFLSIAEDLRKRGGLVGVYGCSLAVRTHAYLARKRLQRGGEAVMLDRDDSERNRLQEIADLDLISPAVDEVLEQCAAEAAIALDLPIGLVSIVLDEAQYFAGRHGLSGWIAEANGTPVEWSFCRHAVATKREVVINDAASDRRVKESPLVTDDGLRCYAGIPLITRRGNVLGTLCAAGPAPRSFSEIELEELRRIARRAIERIEARRPVAN